MGKIVDIGDKKAKEFRDAQTKDYIVSSAKTHFVKDNFQDIKLSEVAQKIKSDDFKDIVLKIRNGQKELKSQLPVFMNSKFNFRNVNGLYDFNYYVWIDIDHIDNPKEIKEMLIEEMKGVTLLFISPSGKGIKGLIKVKNKIHDDYQYKNAWTQITKILKDEFDIENDIACKDICRLSYFSYDDECYYNEDAELFENKKKPLVEQLEDARNKPKQESKDNSRSATEYRYLCSIISKGKNKEECFEEMKAFSKWNESTDAYREHQYKNAKQFIDEKKNNDINNKAPARVFGKIGQAEIYLNQQPIYYAENGLFWFWNSERFCYEMKDETDLLNGIRNTLNVDTINSKERTEIITAIKQVARERKPKDKPLGWLQFEDTLINPINLHQEKASHKYFLTNPIPHKLGKSEDTPIIEQFFREWVVKENLQDESYITSLFEICAYALTDDLFMQRLIALTGGGSNGKGTFNSLIKKLIGEKNYVSIDIKKLSTSNFATSAIYKKLVAFNGEVSYNDLSNTNNIKKLTGEDPIEFEFKGKDSFTDENITTLIISTNSLPRTPDKTQGFYRRWQIIDFPHQFKVKNNVLAPVTELEYENLCLKCVNILHRLYKTNRFTNEGNYEEREEKYEERSNPIPIYIETHCIEDPSKKVPLNEFSRVCNQWLKEKRLQQLTVRVFGKILREYGYNISSRKDTEGNSITYILGISLKNLENEKNTTETTKTTEDSISSYRGALNSNLNSFSSFSSFDIKYEDFKLILLERARKPLAIDIFKSKYFDTLSDNIFDDFLDKAKQEQVCMESPSGFIQVLQ